MMPRHCPGVSRTRSRFFTTAAALNGVPSWKVTPSRSVISSLPGLSFQDAASRGRMVTPSGAISARLSYTSDR